MPLMQPDRKRPLPAPPLSFRSCNKRDRRASATNLLTFSGSEYVRCAWPGCSQQLPERRLDSDMKPYTHDEFVRAHAPVTGKTVRWGIAPQAAQYCSHHINSRASVLEGLGIPARKALPLASEGWLFLHPEDDVATWCALERWLDSSTHLYADEHPKDPWPADSMYYISQVYCLANKVISYVRPNGTQSLNRWTYDPKNHAGAFAQNRRLLLHGAPFDKLEAILTNDLKMSGFEVSSTSGQMLGEGLYLADSFMKSMQYATVGMVWNEPACLYEEVKVLFVVEANIGRPLICKQVSVCNGMWKQAYEEGDITRRDISRARGKRFFRHAERLNSGWARNCIVPADPCWESSASPCLRTTGRRHWKPVLFNEWCVHNTQMYSLAYMVVLKKH